MSVKNLGPKQAKHILETSGDAIYIDVRTEQEFMNGHVPKSINIPVAWPNPSTGQVKPNPDFVNVVSAHFAKDTKIILGCQAGSRSKFAAELLAREGFQDLYNMLGGFDGVRDSMGRLLVSGWSQMGLPVEIEVSPNESYVSLKSTDRFTSKQ